MESVNASSSQRGTAGRHSVKRKRDRRDGSSHTSSRKAPTSRRSTAQNNTNDTTPSFNLDTIEVYESPQAAAEGSSAQSENNAKYGNIDTAAAAAALNQYSMKVPQLRPDNSFLNQATSEGSMSEGGDANEALQTLEGSSGNANAGREPAASSSSPEPPTPPHNVHHRYTHPGLFVAKPAVGSKAYDAQRKANHKEVERRRRETINEGINELAKIVPGCEKSKGHILLKTSLYIQKLQDDANSNIDKWTFEKLITDQALEDMSAKVGQAWQEKNVWKEKAREAGVDVKAVELEMRKAINEVLSDETAPRKDKPGKKPAARRADGNKVETVQRAKPTIEADESESEEEEDEE
ncbi:MAG: basic helix-loop-helix protein [Chrysothrix sp. TS-e1954]|nr:MAG: basic helix-loop-helix protein [Chrysothrix sp. TS-e1954]